MAKSTETRDYAKSEEHVNLPCLEPTATSWTHLRQVAQIYVTVSTHTRVGDLHVIHEHKQFDKMFITGFLVPKN